MEKEQKSKKKGQKIAEYQRKNRGKVADKYRKSQGKVATSSGQISQK